jgi:N4-gp56 family major capsid protein
MPWEETEQYIRSGHRDPSEFQPDSFRTITLSEEEGIKAIVAKPKGSDKMEIQSYLFDKSKGWTLDKAKQWFEQHKDQASETNPPFSNAPSAAAQAVCQQTSTEQSSKPSSKNRIIFEHYFTQEGKKIKGVAAYAGLSRNRNLYLPEELQKADGKKVPVFWEHDYSKHIGQAVLRWNPDLQVLEFEGELFDGAAAPYVSIGADYTSEEWFEGYRVPRNLDFVELSLTQNPGLPLTSAQIVEHLTVTQTAEEAGVAPQSPKSADGGSVLPAAEGGEMTTQMVQASPESAASKPRSLEAEWSTEYINNLPDAAFAVILPGGEKDEEGKTTPRSLRKLPHHNASVKDPDEDSSVDLPHLRNALTRLPQTDLPAEYREKAERHLKAHAERLGVGAAAEEKEEKKMEEKKEEVKETKKAEVKESVKPKVASTEETPAIQEKKPDPKEKYARILNKLRLTEAVTSTTAADTIAQIWQPDMIILPAGITAKLRQFTEVVEIPKGADRVHFTRITTPSFADLTEGQAPPEASQTIDKITVTPVERGAKQSITYTVLESATPDVVEAVERALQQAAVLSEDEKILAALNSASGIAGTLFGGNATQESEVDSTDIISPDLIPKALKLVQDNGYATEPGTFVLVVSPKQYQDLITNSAIQTALQYGTLGGGLEQGVVGRLYGVDIVVSSKVPTGTGAGTPAITTYHAHLFAKNEAVGLGISRNLLIETFRDSDARLIKITASHRIAAAVKQPKAVVRIITA